MAKRQEPKKVIRVVLCGGLMPKQSVEYSAGYDALKLNPECIKGNISEEDLKMLEDKFGKIV